jgi:pimeloyl-ACP methyl ester carboxylesterase
MTAWGPSRRRALGGVAMLACVAAAWALLAAEARAADAAPAVRDCHVAGLRNGVVCGTLPRPLDPARPDAAMLEIRYVVVPALARRKLADPVFLIAGGPGQSAVALAPAVMPLLARLNNRRDIVFVDQRGTGGSAPLQCQEPEHATLAEQSDPERQVRLTRECKARLQKLPHVRAESDLGYFTTPIAVQDLDAVRRALGAGHINLVAFSYGTRVALEYQRQFPGAVRRMVLDGVAPADMALPVSSSLDNQQAFDSLVAACAAEPACARAYPDLRARFAGLLRSLPRQVQAAHALTGKEETFVLTRDMVLGAVRSALYSPPLASALPRALDDASRGELAGLVGLTATFVARKPTRLAAGMHLSVVCAEDAPRMASAADLPGAEFGTRFAALYERLCGTWPRGRVPPEFYTLRPSAVPVLLLSGGIDPATPPRHGERVARALGPRARHVVVANAGHGVMGIGCMRDVVFRFLDASDDAQAVGVDAACAAAVPRPLVFQPVGDASPAASAASPATSAEEAARPAASAAAPAASATVSAASATVPAALASPAPSSVAAARPASGAQR